MYKVGDRVVYIGKHPSMFFPQGEVAEVTEVISRGVFIVNSPEIRARIVNGVRRFENELMLEEIYSSPLYKALREDGLTQLD